MFFDGQSAHVARNELLVRNLHSKDQPAACTAVLPLDLTSFYSMGPASLVTFTKRSACSCSLSSTICGQGIMMENTNLPSRILAMVSLFHANSIKHRTIGYLSEAAPITSAVHKRWRYVKSRTARDTNSQSSASCSPLSTHTSQRAPFFPCHHDVVLSHLLNGHISRLQSGQRPSWRPNLPPASMYPFARRAMRPTH